MLHNSRYQVRVKRAWVAFWQGHGLISAGRPTGDSFNLGEAFSVEHERPILMPGEYAVHLWTEKVGNHFGVRRFQSVLGRRCHDVCARQTDRRTHRRHDVEADSVVHRGPRSRPDDRAAVFVRP